MDLNYEYSAHQQALLCAETAANTDDRAGHLARAANIAARIGKHQNGLGAAAACAWSISQFAAR